MTNATTEKIMDTLSKMIWPVLASFAMFVFGYAQLNAQSDSNKEAIDAQNQSLSQIIKKVDTKSDAILINQQLLQRLIKDFDESKNKNDIKHEKHESRHEYLRRIVNELKSQGKVNDERFKRIENLLLKDR